MFYETIYFRTNVMQIEQIFKEEKPIEQIIIEQIAEDQMLVEQMSQNKCH